MYNKFYGFSEKPFEATPDPKFLYFTPSHREALTSIINSIRSRAGFISITGEVGTGKTTLIRYLLGRLDEKVKTVYVFHPSITFEELLRNIVVDLDLEVKEKDQPALLSQLNKYLAEKTAPDETLVVIIDEAQTLPQEVMEELGRLPDLIPGIPERLQVLFVGQPAFEEKLDSQGLRHFKQKIAVRYRIWALSEEESRKYIGHRLKLVGSSSSKTFTPEAVSMIVSYARGIPRTINILCDNAFMVGYGSSKKGVDVDTIREAITRMEGREEKKTVFGRMGEVAKEARWLSLVVSVFQRRISLVILLVVCIGGLLLLLRGSPQRESLDHGKAGAIPNFGVDRKPSSVPPASQIQTRGMSKSEKPQSPGKRVPGSLETLPSVSPPSASLVTKSGSELFEVVTVVEKGQTLSSLAQKYYGTVNTTLLDLVLEFNPEITNSNIIQVNQTIKIPKIADDLLVIQNHGGTCKIYVGTFPIPDFARVYGNETLLKGREIEVSSRRVSPRDTWYRVLVGKFESRDEAMKVIASLKEKGLLPLFGGSPKLR